MAEYSGPGVMPRGATGTPQLAGRELELGLLAKVQQQIPSSRPVHRSSREEVQAAILDRLARMGGLDREGSRQVGHRRSAM